MLTSTSYAANEIPWDKISKLSENELYPELHVLTKELLDQYPDNPYLLNFYALARYGLNDYKDGIDHLERAVSMQPDDSILKSNLAYGLVVSKNYSAGFESLNDAFEVARNEQELSEVRRVYDLSLNLFFGELTKEYNRGFAKSAISDLKRFLDQHPNVPEAWQFLGRMYESIDRNKARYYYEIAVDKDPTNTDLIVDLADRYLETIESGHTFAHVGQLEDLIELLMKSDPDNTHLSRLARALEAEKERLVQEGQKRENKPKHKCDNRLYPHLSEFQRKVACEEIHLE